VFFKKVPIHFGHRDVEFQHIPATELGEAMVTSVIRITLCVGYWLILTALLLASNPAAVVGLRRVPQLPWGEFGIHLVALTLLTILVHMVGWPKRLNWWLVGVLLFYAIAAEALQVFVPSRCVELIDFAQNVGGVVIGSAIYAAIRSMAQPHVRPNLLEALR